MERFMEQVEAFMGYLEREERSEATREQYRRDICSFLEWSGGRDTAKETVIRYKEELQDRYKPETVNTKLAALNSFFSFLGRGDLRVKQLKIQRQAYCPDEKELTKAEYQRLVDTAFDQGKQQMALILQTICATGIRVSELEFITAEAVEQGEAAVRLKGKNRTILIPGTLGTKILSFLIVPLYTYYIAPSELGDYDILITTVNLLSPLLTMKISDATYRWIINDPENREISISATYQLLIRNCLLCSLLLAGINCFVPIWHCGYFIAILVTNRMMECVQKLLRGVKNQKLFAVSGLFYTGLMVTLNLIQICILGQGTEALLQSVLISQTATIILIFVFDRRVFVYRRGTGKKQLQKEMLRYSIPLVPSALAWWAMSASDRYIIRWILGKEANGIYSVACKFPTILQTMFTMFNNAWMDLALSELQQGKESREYAANTFKKLYQFSFGMTLILIPASKLAMQMILSDSYKTASVYVGFLYLGTVFQGFSSYCSIGYLQGKKTNGAAATSVCGAVINILVNIALVNLIGLYAASISTFAGFFVMWITRLRDTRDTMPVVIEKVPFGAGLFSCIGMALISIWTPVWLDGILTVSMGIVFCRMNREILSILRKKAGSKIGAFSGERRGGKGKQDE